MAKQKYRKELTEKFLHILEEKGLDWKKGWQGGSAPVNAKSGKAYQGMNRMYLGLTAEERGYKDPRWATFLQIKEKGWYLENAKGQGISVEYWFPYDLKKKEALSWAELRNVGGKIGDRYALRARYFTVFNAELIQGIPELKIPEQKDISPDAIVQKLSANMDVEILHDGNGRAFYSPAEDKIHLPLPEYFESAYVYNSTALHELAHATGAEKRLNRDLKEFFGSERYAYEELVAEISSCFMAPNLPIQQSEEHIENHKAYVQSWIRGILEKPETLLKAIQQAEQVADYMEDKAELLNNKEYQEPEQDALESVPEAEPAPGTESDQSALDSFTIYQLKRENDLNVYRFISLDDLQRVGHSVEYQNYDKVYTAALTATDTLEGIYTRFNLNHPEDFKGHSLSVSDIVVLYQDGNDRAYYVDSIGFSEIPLFVEQRLTAEKENQLAAAEMSTRQNYNMANKLMNSQPSELEIKEEYAVNDYESSAVTRLQEESQTKTKASKTRAAKSQVKDLPLRL